MQKFYLIVSNSYSKQLSKKLFSDYNKALDYAFTILNSGVYVVLVLEFDFKNRKWFKRAEMYPPETC